MPRVPRSSGLARARQAHLTAHLTTKFGPTWACGCDSGCGPIGDPQEPIGGPGAPGAQGPKLGPRGPPGAPGGPPGARARFSLYYEEIRIDPRPPGPNSGPRGPGIQVLFSGGLLSGPWPGTHFWGNMFFDINWVWKAPQNISRPASSLILQAASI